MKNTRPMAEDNGTLRKKIHAAPGISSRTRRISLQRHRKLVALALSVINLSG